MYHLLHFVLAKKITFVTFSGFPDGLFFVTFVTFFEIRFL
jgi:hypothetical protein